MAKGFFAIGVYHTKTKINIGTLWRTANLLGASFIYTVGRRYKKQGSDTMNTPDTMPLFHFNTIEDLHKHLPHSCPLIGIELDKDAKPLKGYKHQKRACYLLGAEDHGLPLKVLDVCHEIIKLEGEYSMNVAVAGSLVLYHRECL